MPRRRILIVEDEFLIDEACASVVEEAGFEVAGPYSRLKDVPQELSGISGAIIDISICGVSAYPLIDRHAKNVDANREFFNASIFTGSCSSVTAARANVS